MLRQEALTEASQHTQPTALSALLLLFLSFSFLPLLSLQGSSAKLIRPRVRACRGRTAQCARSLHARPLRSSLGWLSSDSLEAGSIQ